MTMSTMTAAVIHEAGGPDVLKLETRPIPSPKRGEVLIRVRAFGLNRSELFTRQGLSPGVRFPRVLGIEAAGTVEEAPGGEFGKGDKVFTAMGGMGRDFDGSYAEYACVPSSQAKRIESSLPWDVLGAMPEMLQTAWGALFKALSLESGERLLVRGGTTSVGLAAAAIAKQSGAFVISTTRNPAKADALRENGADQVLIDTGTLADQLREVSPGGVDKVLELIGTTTLMDSLRCAKPQGVVCMVGMVGNKWSFDDFSPMEAIPSTVRLTIYDGGAADFMDTPYMKLLEQVERGTLRLPIGRVYRLAEIVEAHRAMEENRGGGKIVILT